MFSVCKPPAVLQINPHQVCRCLGGGTFQRQHINLTLSLQVSKSTLNRYKIVPPVAGQPAQGPSQAWIGRRGLP